MACMRSNSRRSFDLLILLCCLFKCAISSPAITEPVCQDTDYGRSCSLNAEVETFTILDDRLMVGCSNSLFSLGLGLQSDKHVDLSPRPDTYQTCIGFGPGELGNDPSQCTNFVKVIEQVPGDDEKIMVCGTNAFRPKCTLHTVSNISSYEYMTDLNHIDEGFSPYSDDSQIIATLTSSGRFFSGTKFDVYAAPQTIGMAPNPLQRDNTFTVQVPTSDPQWLKQPTFISSYEIGDHIYFFLREPAYEINQGDSVVYSRAIRICKSDNGTTADPNDPSNFFLTFQKARLVCSSSPQQGAIPYTYDNLQSTFLWSSPQGQQFVYGVFTSPANGPSGSAICKFSFDPTSDGSLTKVFEDGDYLVSEGNPPTWSRQIASTFSCPGSSGDQRSPSDATQHQLVYNPVTSMEPEPLFTVFGERITKITVDVINYSGDTQNILYFATNNGDIYQLVMRSEGESHKALIHRTGSSLNDLIIHKNADETRSLYATTENHVLSISRGDCSRYGDCFTCLDSRDAYCGWDMGTKTCKNKIDTNPNLLQSFSATENDITGACGLRTNVPTTTPGCQTSSSQPDEVTDATRTDGDEETTDDNVNCTVTTDGLSVKQTVSIPDLVGATVGAFVVGIPVGAFVCFVFLKLFITPRRHKHAINGQRRSSQRERDTTTVTHVNNRLSDEDQQQMQKKDLTMKENPRYVQQPPIPPPPPPPIKPKPSPLTLAPPPPGNTNTANHKRTNSKDINRYESPEDDDTFEAEDDRDQLPPLRSISSASSHSSRNGHKPNGHTYSHTMNGVNRKRVPGYKVPRGRTDSTTWLRANSESSEPPESPISDV